MIYTLFIYQKFAWLLVILRYTPTMCAHSMSRRGPTTKNYDNGREDKLYTYYTSQTEKRYIFDRIFRFLFFRTRILMMMKVLPVFATTFALFTFFVSCNDSLWYNIRPKLFRRPNLLLHFCHVKWWNVVGLMLVFFPFFVCFLLFVSYINLAPKYGLNICWHLSFIELH